MEIEKLEWEHFVLLGIIGIAIVGVIGLNSSVNNISSKGKTAEIKINGIIGAESQLGSSSTSPEQIRQLIQEAEKDSVEAFIFEINSPGGGAVASKDMAEYIGEIEKPTACLLGEVAASGGYWASSDCDHIIADELTLTGSIGVKSSYLEYTGLLEKLGIQYVNITAGRYKDIGSPFENITEKEKKMLKEQIEKIHSKFIESVAENRNMSKEKVKKYAKGQTFLGEKADEIGLIDETGGRKEVMEYLENRTEQELKTKEYQPEKTFNFLSLISQQIGVGIGKALTSVEKNRGIEALYR
ncbi:MAG: signal peptide peptidase SppA [Candidatus Nanohaloarchaeota archaeon QJJ-9]|nr:signal peptide peptidase SppA [Candidatus Nanohaloarchaeota archaeon QJJ-9]